MTLNSGYEAWTDAGNYRLKDAPNQTFSANNLFSFITLLYMYIHYSCNNLLTNKIQAQSLLG
jgi:hypothetical protein